MKYNLRGVSRLGAKESDRLSAALDLLGRAGAEVTVGHEGASPVLVVDGRAGRRRRADLLAWDDHRVAMSAAVLSLTLPEGSTLDAPGVVSKS